MCSQASTPLSSDSLRMDLSGPGPHPEHSVCSLGLLRTETAVRVIDSALAETGQLLPSSGRAFLIEASPNVHLQRGDV